MDPLDEAIALHNAGALAQAAARYRQVLAREPANFDALHLLGVVALQTGKIKEADDLIGKAIAVLPQNPAARLNHALVLAQLGRHEAALAATNAALAREASNASAWSQRGEALWALGRARDAVASYDRALALKPDAATHNNRGVALAALQDDAGALAAYDAALALQPDYAGAHNNRGIVLGKLRRSEEARDAFDKALTLAPDFAGAWNNTGLALAALNRTDEALGAYARALSLKPDFAEAHNNRGLALAALGQLHEALAAYDKAIALKDDYADAHNNRGAVLIGLKDYAGAAAAYDKAAALEPDRAFLAGAQLHTRSLMCDWRGLKAALAAIEAAIQRGEKASTTFPLLVTSDSAALHRRAAEVWMRANCPPDDALGPVPRRARRDKIRIGYFSRDFRQHAVATLTAGLFEAHDRARFEIFAFSYGPDTGDAMRKRLRSAFDQFVEVRTASDREIALQARAMEIDIAIDLAGYTDGARTGVFALRAAPIQVNYLGYPGTLGAPFMDYIIADNVLIPETARPHYAEKVIALPCFQANDRHRPVPTVAMPRAALGLPENAFVYCSLNAAYKTAPDTFASWMRILTAVEGSVLLLAASNDMAVANLRREAAAQGVAPERLIFSGRVAAEDYLARFRAADLFLDTLPYNAHTTASDALWAGLPVLTQAGACYAGRVGASLLAAAGLTGLTATSAAQYETLAIGLARTPERLKVMRTHLDQSRLSAPLFDTARFTHHLEAAYIQIHARLHEGRAPDHITIAPAQA